MQVRVKNKTYEVTEKQIEFAKNWLKLDWHDKGEFCNLQPKEIVELINKEFVGGWQRFLNCNNL